PAAAWRRQCHVSAVGVEERARLPDHYLERLFEFMVTHDGLQDVERGSQPVNSLPVVRRVLDQGQEAGGVLTVIDKWADHDLGPEAGAVAPAPPAGDAVLAPGQRRPERMARTDVARIGCPQQQCVVASSEAGGGRSEDPLRAPVPADDAASQVEMEDGAVLEAVDQADRVVVVKQRCVAGCRLPVLKREHWTLPPIAQQTAPHEPASERHETRREVCYLALGPAAPRACRTAVRDGNISWRRVTVHRAAQDVAHAALNCMTRPTHRSSSMRGMCALKRAGEPLSGADRC